MDQRQWEKVKIYCANLFSTEGNLSLFSLSILMGGSFILLDWPPGIPSTSLLIGAFSDLEKFITHSRLLQPFLST